MFSRLFRKKIDEKDIKVRAKIPRAPRIRLAGEDRFLFRTGDGQVVQLANVSESGIGLLAPEAPKGTKLRGDFCLFDAVLPVELEAVQWRDAVLGCVVLKPVEEYKRLVRTQLRAEIGVSEVNEVSTQHLRVEDGEKPRWFFAGDTEIFLVERDGGIGRVELFASGAFFLLEPGKRPKTGSVADGGRSKVEHARSEIVQWKDQISDQDLERLPRLIRNIPGLSPADVDRILALLPPRAG